MFERNPWLRLSLVLFLALLARVACGADSTQSVNPTTTSRETATFDTRSATPNSFWIGPGLAFFRSQTGLGVNFGFDVPVSSTLPIFVGADAGLSFWRRDYGLSSTGPSETSTGIHLLPTAYYRFAVPFSTILHPYAGISLGPAYLATRANSGGQNPVVETTSRLHFAFLVRLGMGIDLSKTLAANAEVKFGILDRDFIYLPQANLSFAI